MQVKIKRTRPDITTIYHASQDSGFIEIKSNLKRKKLHGTNLVFKQF